MDSLESRHKPQLTDFQTLRQKFGKYLSVVQDNTPVKIGYYPVQARGQLIRLICEYMKVPYQNLFFTPQSWETYKNTEAREWSFKKLPFVKDAREDGFIVTETLPCCIYLINKEGRGQLLGKGLADKTKVDMFLWSYEMLGNVLGCYLNLPCEELSKKSFLTKAWDQTFSAKIITYQRSAKGDNEWYLGYLTIIDFSLYMLVPIMNMMFKEEMNKFPKLKALHKKVGQLTEVKQYQQSSRMVNQVCPITFFHQFKQYVSMKGQGK